jgi:hypothetical protein
VSEFGPRTTVPKIPANNDVMLMDDGVADRSQFVLRLLVVKVEGVLVPPLQEWVNQLAPVDTEDFDLTGDELFPDWVQALNVGEETLRSSLVELAESDRFEVDDDLKNVIEYAHDHSPVRVALLSSGPEEWLKALSNSLSLADHVDLHYSYDRYTSGTRRTLLQFLMNRFIAGRERTLLLGNTVADERLAEREETRFRSFRPPPSEARQSGNWDWDADRLLEFIREKQPES